MIKYFTDPILWIVVGGVISVFASYIAAKKQDRETKDQMDKNVKQQTELNQKAVDIIKKQDDLDEKNTEIRNQQGQLITKQQEMFLMAETQLKEQATIREKAEINERLALQLAQSQGELIEAQQKLAELSTERYNSTTGKDSYCYAALSISPDPNVDQVNVYLHHVGKYGLRNLEVFIVNTDIEFGQILDKTINYKDAQEDYHNYKNPYHDGMASFTPDDVPTPLKSFRTVRRDQKSFHIRFKTDNKTWYQRVLLRRVGGYEIKPEYNSPIYDYDNWFLVAYQVYEVDKWGYAKVHRYEKILMESIVTDENYLQTIKSDGRKIWRPFPLKRGEIEYLPYLRWPSLHWDGASFDRNPALPSSK